jgi:hypothetical protein
MDYLTRDSEMSTAIPTSFRAAKNGAIVDARDISIVHHHPFFEERPLDATYERGNDPAEYERAKAIFDELHPK